MSLLSFSDMPMSFTGQALLWGASSNILNPPNQGQGFCQRFIGKPLRAIARLTYLLGITILGPVGLFYHLGMALIHKRRSIKLIDASLAKQCETLATEHLKACMHDAITILTLSSRAPSFFDRPSESVYPCLSSSLVQSTPLSENDTLGVLAELFPYSAPFHRDNAAEMAQGHYRFDELVQQALMVRDYNGDRTLPSLNDVRVHRSCFSASYQGRYGLQPPSPPFFMFFFLFFHLSKR